MSVVTDLVSDVFGGGGSDAASQAARAQSEAAQAGITEQRRQFDISQTQAEPFRQAELRSLQRGEPFAQAQTEAAQEALTQRRALTGLGGVEAQQQAFAGLQESPGQQFLRQRQQRALLRNQAAIGGLGGGNVRTALQEQAAGFAQQDIGNQLARLQGFAPGAQFGTGTTQQLSQLGGRFAGNIANLQSQAGQAQASGILGAQQARTSGASNLIGLGASLLSDENMKQNIKDMTPEDCMKTVLALDIKAWEYLPGTGLSEGLHIGPMSQNSPECIKVDGKEMLDLHSELMLIAGAMQHLKNEGLIKCHL